ncbi:hypothetical protein PEL8287_01832 [Roseovarius litorisediminis]|uniref:Uncharacterized protein n=1 Tax=Roseovarius litorisediminis TaxID=1312363 RepID=A0A1Y5SHN3_9RHOB|nr:hypothetical protein PEL8287_01832 [Roseovarius litorisediminis]
MKSNGNPLDPTQRLRDAPRCSARPSLRANVAAILLSKVGTSAACTALAVVRHRVQPI